MTVRTLSIDVETRSVVDLKATNAFVYFEDSSTDLWCLAWCFSDQAEPELWWPGDPCPDEVREHIENGGICNAFNAAFEILAFRHLLGPRYRWPVPDLRQWRCTMVKCLAMALPGKLEHVAPALGLDVVKDQAGHRLMLQLSKPRKPRKNEPRGLYWWTDPEKIARLGRYCQQDVRTEMAVDARVLPLSPAEQELWFIDQLVNSHGVYIDDKLCYAGKRVVEAAQKRLDAELAKLTDHAVTAVTNTGQLTTWLRSKGLDIPGVAKDVIEELSVRDDLAPDVARVVEIRAEGGKSSVSKLDAMLARRQKDGRMRGNTQFHGAATGRDAGRGAQLYNLTRPSEEFEDEDKQTLVEVVLESKDDTLIEAMYGNALTVVADCIRSVITAGPGNDLMAADYESIESVVNAWLAGEQSKLHAFEDYFAGRGPKIYNVVAADVYNVPVSQIDKKSQQYMVGKVTELSMGFGGGPGAFAKMAKNYKLDIAAANPSVLRSATPENLEKAEKGWEQRGAATGMSKIRWVTAELVKLAWRDRNPAIVQYWKDLESAAIEAVQNPGRQVTAGATGKIDYKRVGSFLFCRLPSGRALCYPYPRIVQSKMPWKGPNGEDVFKDALIYKGIKGVARKWQEQSFYGGLADENVVQATARDCMVNGMLKARAKGYPHVLTIYDEVIAEGPKGFGSLEEFSGALTDPAPWMKGLPIAASGFRAYRYRK
jgi:DNA polymerase